MRRSLGESAAARLLGPGHATSPGAAPGRPAGSGESPTVIRRFSTGEQDSAPASLQDEAPGVAELSGPELDQLVDKVVDAIEQRVVDELERRGRRNLPEVF